MKITKSGCTVTFSLFTTGFTWTLCMLFQDLHRLLLWWNTSQSFPTKTRKVQQLLQERNIKSGVKALYSMAWTNLKRGIKRLRGTTRRGLRSIYNKDTQETISWWTPHFKRFLTSHHSLFQAGEQFLSESHQGITHHLAPYIIVDIMYNNATHVCFHAIVLCHMQWCIVWMTITIRKAPTLVTFHVFMITIRLNSNSSVIVLLSFVAGWQSDNSTSKSGHRPVVTLPPSENSARCRQTTVLSVLDHRTSFRVASPERKASGSRRRPLPSQYGSVAEKGSM